MRSKEHEDGLRARRVLPKTERFQLHVCPVGNESSENFVFPVTIEHTVAWSEPGIRGEPIKVQAGVVVCFHGLCNRLAGGKQDREHEKNTYHFYLFSKHDSILQFCCRHFGGKALSQNGTQQRGHDHQNQNAVQ